MYNRDCEIKFLSRVFEKFDENNDRYLDITEYTKFIYKIAENSEALNCVNDVIIHAVFDYHDTDTDDLLSFDDILDWWTHDFSKFYIHKNCELLAKAHDIFSKYSIDKSLTYLQFEKLSTDNNIANSGTIFDAVDSDENGMMNFKEFVLLLGWI